MTTDEEKDVVYIYPEDHEEEELQGVEAVFHISVTNVQTVSLPELNDEFAKSASDFETLEELNAGLSALKPSVIEEETAEFQTLWRTWTMVITLMAPILPAINSRGWRLVSNTSAVRFSFSATTLRIR